MVGSLNKNFTDSPFAFESPGLTLSGGGAQYPQEYFSGQSAAGAGYYSAGDPALTSPNFTHRSEYGTDRFGVNLDKTNFNGGGKRRSKRRKRRKSKRIGGKSRRRSRKSRKGRKNRRKSRNKKIKSMRSFRAWKRRTYK